MANVVLVHGAWSDPTVWQEVSATLRQDGHHTVAVELPMTSLDDDMAVTRRGIATLTGPVTLVGHSYGGSVISGAARHQPRVASLVFVAAYVLDEAETIPMVSARGTNMPGRAAIRFAADGWSDLDPHQFGSAVAHDLPEETARALAASQRPTHGSCLTTPAGRGAWHDLSCAYVVSAEDRILDPGLQRWFAERSGADVTELPASHFSPLSRPRDVAEAITTILPTGNGDPRDRNQLDEPARSVSSVVNQPRQLGRVRPHHA